MNQPFQPYSSTSFDGHWPNPFIPGRSNNTSQSTTSNQTVNYQPPTHPSVSSLTQTHPPVQNAVNSNPCVFVPMPVFMSQQPYPHHDVLPVSTTYKVSFVNDTETLRVEIGNDLEKSFRTQLVGKGTRFECEIPVNQAVNMRVIAVPVQPEPLGIIAQVDNDPFRLRNSV